MSLRIVEIDFEKEDQPLHLAFSSEYATETLCGRKFYNTTGIQPWMWEKGEDRVWCRKCGAARANVGV